MLGTLLLLLSAVAVDAEDDLLLWPISRERDFADVGLGKGHDVFVQAATSFGKSLCFQLPAVIDLGITIVVSPLLALMNNQVDSLRAADIAVATINSNTRYEDRDATMKDLCCGHPTTRLLYVTPELILTESFRIVLDTIYRQGELSRIAIDEAHCISEWGHDFRPAYYHLSHFRSNYPDVPIICATATATPSVQSDILKTLGMSLDTTKRFVASTARRNLHYEVGFTSDESDNRFTWLMDFLQGLYLRRSKDPARLNEIARDSNVNNQRPDAVSGIIYVSFRAECDSIAARLRANDIGAVAYHAGLSTFERKECQRKWLNNSPGYNIIVATTAFGMGIDKHDVRFVVHWTLAKSFEGYYQEAGRAGRDGKAALCMLFYSREDRDRVGYRIAKDANLGSDDPNEKNQGANAKAEKVRSRVASFQELVKYCEQTETCRHVLIGSFFGEENVQLCDHACDYCFRRQGALSLRRKKNDGLSSEEWVSTQKERVDFYGEGYD